MVKAAKLEDAGGGLVLAAETARGSAHIAIRLRQAIEDGAYRRGEPLPPERNLAGAFGVSRSTVRKALARLEEAGLVVRRVGSGTFVTHDPADVADVTSPLELIEARLGVERHMTRLAVIKANRRDLQRLGLALEKLEASGADAEHFTEADQRFHLQLAACTHNPLFVAIYRQINDIRNHDQWSGTKDKVLSPAGIAEYNRQHRALYEAIQRRDAEAAVAVITAHLEKARQDLLGVDSG